MDKRVARSCGSMRALQDLLKRIRGNPSSFSIQDDVRNALSSQGALAKYSNAQLGIFPMSLNTAKRVADTYFDGGYGEIERLRLECKEAVASAAAPSIPKMRTTREDLRKRIQKLERDSQQCLEDLFLITMLLDRALKNAMNYARQTEKEAVVELCRRESRQLLAMLERRSRADVGVVISVPTLGSDAL